MPFEPATFLLLVLLGGWVAADGTGLGQLMISRPLVAATLAGWLVGAPVAGAAVGLVLEVFHLTVLPVGAARYPEAGPGAVVAGAAYGISDGHPTTLLTVVVFALIFGAFSDVTVRAFRKVNGRLLHAGDDEIGDEGSLERRHLSAMALDVFRGAALVGVGLVLLHQALLLVSAHTDSIDELAQTVLRLSVIILLASALRLFGRRLRFVAAGAVAGMILLLLRG